ncbi:MAG TPA: DUF2802 domain-containing protein [Gammaproteobacteria bacterium]
MMGATTAWVAWLSAAAALGVALLGAAALRLRGRAREQARRLEAQQAEIAALRSRVQALDEERLRRREELRRLSEQVAGLVREHEQLLARDAVAGPYVQAVRAARSGVTAEVLMASYGLSRGEAELVVALHQRAPQGGD